MLRHAQSAGKQSTQGDYDRDLTSEGAAKAKALGQKLKKEKINIDLILSSGAARARRTVWFLNETLQLTEEKIQFETELYDAILIEWIDQIHKLPDDVHVVMVAGHNPAISMLATNFHNAIVDLGPGELIAFEFNVNSWAEIANSGKEILNIK